MDSSGPGTLLSPRRKEVVTVRPMHPLINKILRRCRCFLFTCIAHRRIPLGFIFMELKFSHGGPSRIDRISTFETSLKPRYTS